MAFAVELHDRMAVDGTSRARPDDARAEFSALRATGDARLRADLIERFLPLAHGLAARYARARESGDDLRQVACVGLIKAVDGYEPDRGRPFAAYAVPTILGELRRHFRQAGWSVHVPRALQERTLAVRTAVDALSTELGRAPTPAEVGERIGASGDEVIEALEGNRLAEAESLDASANEDGFEYHELIGGDDPSFAAVEDQLSVAPAIRELPDRERMVLGLRYFGELTQAEIARSLGMSQMQVSRVLRRTLRELRADVLADAA